jgi:hypothetical protein
MAAKSKGYTSLCLFLPTGKTFTFHNVEIVTNNETHLEIEYLSMSDGAVKHLQVLKANIIGWTRWVKET